MPKLSEAKRKQEHKSTNAERLAHVPVVYPRANADDLTVLAVDPGEHHVGVALGCRKLERVPCPGAASGCAPCRDGVVKGHLVDRPVWPGWRVYDVAEMTPWEFVKFFRSNIESFDAVTVEKFTLYPDKAKEQIGSEMPTSKLIGWIEFTIRMWNEVLTQTATAARGWPGILYFSYPAAIHKGTTGVLRHTGIELVSPATPDHARSAELHFWHTLIRAGLVEGVTLS